MLDKKHNNRDCADNCEHMKIKPPDKDVCSFAVRTIDMQSTLS